MSEHVEDLTSIFGILRKHKLRLNASKCSFGVGSRKFLGYMVTHRGIEVNPDQIKTINDLQAPRNPKEVQKLTGMTAALNGSSPGQLRGVVLFSVYCISGEDLNGPRSVLWHSNN